MVIVKVSVQLVVAVAPLVTVALTTTVPADVVFSTLPVMLAPVAPAFSIDQTMVRLVAVVGFASVGSVIAVPAYSEVGTPVTPVTGTNTGLMVIVKVFVQLVVAVAPLVTVALTTTVPAVVVFSTLPVMLAPVVPAFSID